MNPQNQGSGSSTPLEPPQRRKRGRPRKDENLLPGENMFSVPMPDNLLRNTQAFGSAVAGSSEMAAGQVIGNNMIGQAVSGVVDGKFDAGYLLRVKVGDSDNYLRGVVFLPNRVVPVSASNDLAPQVKMYTRADVPIPVMNQPQFQGPVPPSEQSEKQSAEPKGFKPTFEDQGMSSDHHQTSAATCKENQFASVTLPLTDNFRAGLAPVGKIMSQQFLDSGSDSRSAPSLAPTGGSSSTAAKQDELLLEFDASMKKVASDKVEAASNSSRPEAPPTATFSILPASGAVNLELQIQHQANDFSVSQSVLDGAKTTNLELIQPPAITEPGSTIISSESADGMNISLANPSSPTNAAEFPQGPATDAPSDLNGGLVAAGHAAEFPQADTKLPSTNNLPAVLLEKEAIFSMPKSDSEGSSLQKILESQFGCSSTAMDIMKLDPPSTNQAPMDLFGKDADPSEPNLANDGAFMSSMTTEPQMCTSSSLKDAES